jgi:hypothetical protein
VNPYTLCWLFWLAMAAVVEGAALIDKRPNDTLTEHIMDWMSWKKKAGGWLLRRSVLAVFMLWLTAHFLSGGRV